MDVDLRGNRKIGNKIGEIDNPFEESRYKVDLRNKHLQREEG